MTKNADIDKYGYSGYGIGFDRHGNFSFNNGIGRNTIIFGVDMSSSTKIDDRKKDISILSKGPQQVNTSSENIYTINFTKRNKKFCLTLYYNGANSYLFANGKKIHKFKSKDCEIILTPLRLENISKDWSVDNIKKTGLNRHVYDFSVDYVAVIVDDILEIHNYLIKNNGVV